MSYNRSKLENLYQDRGYSTSTTLFIGGIIMYNEFDPKLSISRQLLKFFPKKLSVVLLR